MAIQQPPWSLPKRKEDEPVLKIYNSLTKSKTEFVAINGRHVKWYNCGPTVYDASHMGHARNYVTQDVLRRIMTDYFDYDVHFVMNITDIDDKIILRARQSYLVKKFRSETDALSRDLVDQLETAWADYVQSKVSKGLPDTDRPSKGKEKEAWPQLVTQFQDKVWKQEGLKRDEKFEMHFSAAHRTYAALLAAGESLQAGDASQQLAHRLIDDAHDILAISLDKQHGSSVTDHSIFRSLAAYWEDQFFKDMRRLRVRDPDTLTRVTEFVPEIASFVEGIVKNGYAYEVDGSVYFDTRAFDKADGHYYAKIEPWSKGNRELLEEGEGALTATTGKRSSADFALWKASKPGEPSWPSPWGPGRPGWHIECSVMASAVLGDNMDIHSGGIDLAFPHHDNEMAQSEAYHNCSAWVNYFIHTGHLHIEGLKMSKSLKNFITIDEILQKYTARQLRLAFLSQLWNARVDFSESLMTGEVRNFETTFNNFFVLVKALITQANEEGARLDGRNRFGDAEHELTNSWHRLQSSQHGFRVALCDSFNTPEALNVLRELVSRTNVYINSRGKDLEVGVVVRVAGWVGKMLRMLGLGEGETSEIGWGQERYSGEESVDREEILMPYLRTLASFRDGVRKLAIAKGDAALKDILALSDKLRDVDLVPLGVALDDLEDGKALVKLVPPAELLKAREEKRVQAEAKTAKKAAAVEADRQKRLQKLEKGRVAPQDMFKPPHVREATYGSWDESGLPLTDGDGKELSKNQSKKVQKEWANQRKLHEEFLAWQENE
ncbi:tRNA synthetases class I (C) catalytic domain-containing protein [Fomitopsis serialis]|uniref:tRNA synthetases class I (C) catalytic domain-containing protein n=1 Tax=Fomitopsis serialis TaxID=139415 RepID=UPI002007EC99|nr:tRNA synthetases class I (C) catalytic domain-containing protein [Neoantrodia serialis]KAH9920166.1 tRNA synthetases class I (C) catalytic domain-containing protein [Neoantrodia serialis]